MGTYDTRGGHPLHDPMFDYDPVTKLQEDVLELLEAAGIPEAINDKIIGLIMDGEHQLAHEGEADEIELPTPLGALRFRMEQGGHTQADLAKLIGSRSHAAEILSGKRSLSKAHIRVLSDQWGMDARVLLGPSSTTSSDPQSGEAVQASSAQDEPLSQSAGGDGWRPPEGWALVPKTPDVKMVAAWWQIKNTGSTEPGEFGEDHSDYAAYRAMISAAPTPQVKP